LRCVGLRRVECDTIGGYNGLLLLVFIPFEENGNEIYDIIAGVTIPSKTNQEIISV